MGIFGRFFDKVLVSFDRIKDRLLRKKYDENAIKDHVDVDSVLAEFRESIQNDVEREEKKSMDAISNLFLDLMDKTKDKFSDLVEIIENEQKNAENELNGTIINYVKEHLSKNDEKFLLVLKMTTGMEKKQKMESAMSQVFDEANKEFCIKLKKYTEKILEEFTVRLNTRIDDQEKQMNLRISELEKLEEETEHGLVDVDALEDSCVPTMECAECILQLLGMEM